MMDFRIFFPVMLVHMSVLYVDNISHVGLSVCFWQIKRLVLFWCALRFFCFSKKMDQRNCLCKKLKLNVQGHLKCWLWPLASLLCGIKSFRKAEKKSMNMRTWAQLWYKRFKNDDVRLDYPMRTLQPMRTLKQWRKWFWIIVESLLETLLMILEYSLGSCQAIFTNVLGMKRQAAKIV